MPASPGSSGYYSMICKYGEVITAGIAGVAESAAAVCRMKGVFENGQSVLPVKTEIPVLIEKN